MVFKINIGAKSGKTYKLEAEALSLNDKQLGDTVDGIEISPDLEGYKLEITGASDKSGFPALKEIKGFNAKKALLTYGIGLHKKPKGEKKIGSKPKGLRLRKSVRGNIISPAIVQINTKVIKEGAKKLEEIFAAPATEGETPAAQ